jgi:NitT/TauT family transport system ATP-binding protein
MRAPLDLKVQVHQLTQIYKGQGGVGPISFEVEPGEFVAILGASGSGKSTLLRLLGKIESPSAGEVHFPDADSPMKWGYVFQDSALLPWQDAFNNVILPARLSNTLTDSTHARAKALLEQLGLQGAEHRYPHELSGGMKMRVSLARALLGEPSWLALDEPFSALDEPVRWALAEDLRSLWLRTHPTVFFVTHSILEALSLATRVLVLDGSPGKIVLDRTLPWPKDRSAEVRGDPEFIRLTEEIYQLLQGRRKG